MSRYQAGRSTRRQGNGAVERVNAMLEEKLDAGLEYEALQLYKGQAARKAAKGDYDGAAALAEAGAEALMKRGFVDSASELGHQLVEIFKDGDCAVTSDRLAMIHRLDSLYTEVREGKYEFKGKGSEAGLAQAGKLQAKFLKASVTWTVTSGTRQHGDATLNVLLGRCLFAINNIEGGASRMVAGENPKELVALINACNPAQRLDATNTGSKQPVNSNAPSEVIREQIFCLAVLHFLSLGNLRDANVALTLWVAVYPNIDNSGMVRFCRLLCKTCEYDAGALFQGLVDTLRSSGDSNVEKHLAQIGKVYFNIMPPPSMLDGILGMLGMS